MRVLHEVCLDISLTAHAPTLSSLPLLSSCPALQVRPFIDALVDKTRREMLLLLSEGYSLVAPSKAASMLGVSEGELGHLVEGAGWKQDIENGMYSTAVQGAADTGLDSYENLQQLAQYMVNLEA
jgi:hypothetical protein